jgi:hemerythrin
MTISALAYNVAMRVLEWSTSDAVFVTELDDEHKEIFDAVARLQQSLDGPPSELVELTQGLVDRIEDHFAHEERLMRAARYDALRWHKEKHDAARKRVGQFVVGILQGEATAGPELVEFLAEWLQSHTHTADAMLAAFLRNHQRGLFKMRFRAGTMAVDACAWVDSYGRRFDPKVRHSGY